MDNHLLKAEKAGCWGSGQLRFVPVMTISIVPSVSVSPRTSIEDVDAPRGFSSINVRIYHKSRSIKLLTVERPAIGTSSLMILNSF